MSVTKYILLVICYVLVFCSKANAQKPEIFEGITYTAPKNWQKQASTSAVQIGIDGAKGTCLITLFKPIPGTDDPKANFKTAWDTIVKDTVKVTSKPEIQPSTTEDGWTVESGSAPYESGGKKGLVVLITMSGNTRMVNILVLTNTDTYQSAIAAFLVSVHLPKLTARPVQPVRPADTTDLTHSPAPRQSKFQFTTTNFDDGWTSVEQDDWVQVTQGSITALVHYPNQKADAYNSVLKTGLQNAWNILVAPRYSNIRNFELKPVQSFESISFAEADAENKATHKNVHVVLFKKHFSKGNGKYIEFVTATKDDFEQAFGPYHNDEFGWDKLVAMQGKNRFAVSSKDIVGKWTTQDFASLAYYYANGRYAGATATSTADEFTFSGSGTYQSDHSGASGLVGSQKFSRQVYKGNFSTDNWKLTLTNRFQGNPETYTCYFEAVKGGRILMLTDQHNTVFSLGKK